MTEPALPADFAELAAGAEGAFGRLCCSVASFSDADVRAASLLPGWSRAHVLTHLARNADGQRRMLAGALRDEVVAQYAEGDEGRARDIETGADRSRAAVVEDLIWSHAAMIGVWAQLGPAQWERATAARVGQRPAWRSVWARWREVEIHHIDLRVGYGPSQWPEGFVSRALPRVLADRTAVLRAAGIAVEGATPSPSRRPTATDAPAVTLRGSASWLLAWLIGRHPLPGSDVSASAGGQGVDVPSLPAWV